MPNQNQCLGPVADRHKFGQPGKGFWFLKLPLDLGRAWDFASVSACDRRLLGFVREATWRDPSAPCRLNISALARLWRLPRSYVSTSLKRLVGDAMLVRAGDGYVVGTDVHAWLEHGRIHPDDVRLAVEGYAEGRQPQQTAPYVPADAPRMPQVTPPYAPGDAPRMSEVTLPVSPDGHPHSRNAGASGDSIQIPEEGREAEPAPTAGTRSREDREATARDAAAKSAPPDAPGYDKSTPADRKLLDEAARLAADIWPDAFDIHRAILNRDGGFKHGWYLAAVRALRGRSSEFQKRSYFLGILKDYLKTGGPPEGEMRPDAAPKAVEYFRADPDTLYEPRTDRDLSPEGRRPEAKLREAGGPTNPVTLPYTPSHRSGRAGSPSSGPSVEAGRRVLPITGLEKTRNGVPRANIVVPAELPA